jgi:hypothetical protein
LNGDAIALPSGEDGIDTAVTDTIAWGIGKTIPICQQPQGWQQRTHHESEPIHQCFDAGKSKMFNVPARKGRLMDAALSPEDQAGLPTAGGLGLTSAIRERLYPGTEARATLIEATCGERD